MDEAGRAGAIAIKPRRMRCALTALLVAAARAVDTIAIDASAAPSLGLGPIAPDFASFSYEVHCAPAMLTLNGAPRASFVTLMRALQSLGGARGPNIRVGGNSADESAYLPPSTPLPPDVKYRIGPADLAAYPTVALWNGSVTLGVNFRGGNDATLELAHAAAIGAAIPWASGVVEALEVGNENDLYVEHKYRPASYTGADYAAEATAVMAALATRAAVPPRRFQGATFCCDKLGFDAALPAYYAENQAALRSVSYHSYPLNVCNGKAPPSIADLLATAAVTKNVAEMVPRLAAARAASLPFFIGEGNSVACGGQAGVSDTFAAALWALDALLAHAAIGVARWNWHGCPSGAYTPIGYDDVTTDVPRVNPLFYGLFAFSTAARGGLALVNASIASTSDLVRAFAGVTAAGEWRVVVLHKDPAAAAAARATVTLPVAAARACAARAALVRLTAPAADATTGVAFGGATWDGSTTGAPSGAPSSEPVAADADGSFAFLVQPASAVVFSC